VIARRGVLHGSGLGRERWVVEHTLAWLYQFKWLRVRWEHRADLHEAFLKLATSLICWRIPDRVIFDKLLQVLVFGCGYDRIADHTCSARTLRRRRDEWIAAGIHDRLHQIALAAYDRILGLELAQLAVDGCITKAPCGGEVAARSPVDRGKQGGKRSLHLLRRPTASIRQTGP
jgi:transposase